MMSFVCLYFNHKWLQNIPTLRIKTSLVPLACWQAVVCIHVRVQSPANLVTILDELVKDLGQVTPLPALCYLSQIFHQLVH